MTGAIVARIDKAVEDLEALRSPRGHLGASQIGSRCARKVWYGFRWAYRARHKGRLLRLFNRGHAEEFNFVAYLRGAGYEVRDYSQRLMYHDASDAYITIDWDAAPSYSGTEADDQIWRECDDVSEDRVHIQRATARGQGPEQYGFVDHDKHFAGSTDGKVRGPELPEGWGGLEFKTSNDKSFQDLVKKGVVSSKLTHYVQMQIYMHYLGLKWMLYLVVNKNDDNIYEEIVYYKPEVAEHYANLALQIIGSPSAPKRLSMDPSWFECRYCDFREICHYGAPPQINCRSCAYARAAPEGTWYCQRFNQTIPGSFIPHGCQQWEGVK